MPRTVNAQFCKLTRKERVTTRRLYAAYRKLGRSRLDARERAIAITAAALVSAA